MNERIKQLAEQAGLKSMPAKLTIYKNDDETYSNIWEYPLEKFAELIVKECINVCEPVLDEPYEDMSEFGKGLVEGQDVAVEKIKQHFGVEE
jgi:hypothetical protein